MEGNTGLGKDGEELQETAAEGIRDKEAGPELREAAGSPVGQIASPSSTIEASKPE